MPGQTREDRRRTDEIQAEGKPADERTSSSKAVVTKLLKTGETSGGRLCDGKRMWVRFFGDFTTLKKVPGVGQTTRQLARRRKVAKRVCVRVLSSKIPGTPGNFCARKRGSKRVTVALRPAEVRGTDQGVSGPITC